MSSTDNNGAAIDAPDFEHELLDYASGLRAMLARESTEVERLKTMLDDARKRQARVQKAIDVLTGESSKPKPAAFDSGARRKNWQVSDAKLDRVWRHVRERTDTFTRHAIGDEIHGISHDSVHHAFERLRAMELLRITGREGRGGGMMYGVMPGMSEREAITTHAT